MSECWDGPVQDVTGPWININTGDGGGGIDTVTVVVLPHGATPTAALDDGTLTLGIPAGAPGVQGPPGEPGPPGLAPEVVVVASIDDAIGLPAGTWVLVVEP